MKFCQDHWNNLREAISARGLDHLVARSGEEAIQRAEQEINNTATDANYDPLMSAHWMIMGNALQGSGLYLMTGDYCPLCEVNKYGGSDQEWIDGATDAVLEYCKENYLTG